MRKSIVALTVASLILASGIAIAGGCLQGTYTYTDAAGRVVGQETFGCGELDSFWGVRTANKVFTQGCGGSEAF